LLKKLKFIFIYWNVKLSNKMASYFEEMNYTAQISSQFYEINNSGYGQFVDIEKQIVYIPPYVPHYDHTQIIYCTTSFSVFQLIMIFILLKIFHIL